MSERATALEDAVMDWIEEDDEVQEFLGSDGGVIPVTLASESDDLDPRISVGASMTSTDRENVNEAKQLEVRVIIDGTKQFAKREQVRSLKLLKDRVADLITTHRDGWGSDGISDDEEIAWSDEVNRYLGVLSAGFERTDPHAYYD